MFAELFSTIAPSRDASSTMTAGDIVVPPTASSNATSAGALPGSSIASPSRTIFPMLSFHYPSPAFPSKVVEQWPTTHSLSGQPLEGESVISDSRGYPQRPVIALSAQGEDTRGRPSPTPCGALVTELF